MKVVLSTKNRYQYANYYTAKKNQMHKDPASDTKNLFVPAVIGRLSGNGYGVRMAFDQAGIRDAGQAGICAKIIQAFRPGIPHSRTQATHQLVDKFG